MERFQSLALSVLIHKTWLASEMRVKVNTAKVKQYAGEKKRGSRFPPPVVFVGDDGVYRVGDGFHRLLADKENKVREVTADVRPGGLKEAILFNLKANQEANGLPFQPGDLKKSVKTLLTSPEFADWTRMAIHKAVGCSYSLVSVVAKEIGLPRCKTGVRPVVEPVKVAEMLASGKTHKEVAEELKVSPRTIYRREVSSQFEDCPHCHGTGKVLKKRA
jgi:Homeodomain-like domain